MTTEEWKDCLRQYERLIFSICYQMVQDLPKAQDLTQETFLAAYRHRGICSREGARPWLSRIAMNKAKDYLKSAAYTKKIGELPEDIQSSQTPEQIIIDNEGYGALLQMIEELGEPYNFVCRRILVDGKTIEEVAEGLGRPKKTVETQYYRGRKKLQEKWKEGMVSGRKV